jgi:hypothetical protein
MSEETTRGLPDDLVAALRDPSIAVPKDAAVFNLFNTWLAAPSATVSAEIRSDLRSPFAEMCGSSTTGTGS